MITLIGASLLHEENFLTFESFYILLKMRHCVYFSNAGQEYFHIAVLLLLLLLLFFKLTVLKRSSVLLTTSKQGHYTSISYRPFTCHRAYC